MPIRTFLRKFARACRYRTDAADVRRFGLVQVSHAPSLIRWSAGIDTPIAMENATTLGNARYRIGAGVRFRPENTDYQAPTMVPFRAGITWCSARRCCAGASIASLQAKFGLSFVIVDCEYLVAMRRDRGDGAAGLSP